MKNLVRTIVMLSLMLCVSLFGIYNNIFSLHGYEAGSYPLLFVSFLVGALMNFLEIGFCAMFVIIFIVYIGVLKKTNFVHNDAVIYRNVCIIFNIADFLLATGANSGILYFTNMYQPFGRGNDGTFYLVFVAVYAGIKLLINIFAIFFSMLFIIDNSDLMKNRGEYMPVAMQNTQLQMLQMPQFQPVAGEKLAEPNLPIYIIQN